MKTILAKRKRAVALASVALGAIVVAGCNLLVSAGDYHVDESSTGDATTDTAPPPNGADGSQDSGPVADSNGGDTGQGDTSDLDSSDLDSNQGDSNQGDSNDAAPACGSTLQVSSTDFQQLMRACVLDVACDYDNYNNNNGSSIGDCIAENSLATFGATACELTATSCADIESCTGQGFSSQCDGGATTAFCDKTNNLAQNCTASSGNYGPGYLEDCTKYGGTCKVYDGGDGVGPVADCEIVATCTGDPTLWQCSGNDLYQCHNGVGYGPNCHQFQATCAGAGTANGANCFYNLPSCGDAGTAPSCDQAFGQFCFPDTNQLGRYNCGRAGLACVPIPNPASGDLPFECLAPGCTDNDVSNCVSSCNNTVATFCVGGAAVPFDCATLSMGCDDSLGFAQCYQNF